MKKINSIKAFIKKNKKVYIELLINDFRTRYNGSFLGTVWGFVQPLVTLLVYWIVFQYGMRSGARPDGVPYAFYMTAGAIAWFYFSEAWGGITSSFLDYSYLVKKLNFDIRLLPMVKLGSAFLIHIVFIIISTILLNFGGYYANWYYIQIIYYTIAISAFTMALGLITSSLAVYIRDIMQIVGIILQIGFWINPICWGSEMLHGVFEVLLKMNPLYYCIVGYRDCLIYRKGFWEEPLYTLYFWGVTLVLFMLGRYMYNKLRPNFADVM